MQSEKKINPTVVNYREGRVTKILFVTGSFGVGGKERQLTELIKKLSPNGYELHLLVKNHSGHYLDDIQSYLKSFRSLEQRNFRIFDFYTFTNCINAIEPDIVCSWATVTSHFSLLARYCSSHPFTLINCSIRNAPIKLSARLKFERAMYTLYSKVVANSYAGLKAYNQYGKKGRFVLYNGLDFSRIPTGSRLFARKQLGFDPKQFIVVMVASLSRFKDHETLLKAAYECRNHVDIKFLIVGDGGRRDSLERMAQELGLLPTVTFLGQREDVELIFKAADISVLASTAWYGEGISNSILESMACGTPVIATDSPGSREVIVNNESGYIVTCGDYKSIADKIVELQYDPEAVKGISEKAKTCIKEKFSIDQLRRNFETIVQNCLEK